MNQNSSQTMQRLMQEFHMGRHKLGEQVKIFQSLQQEIQTLKQRAPHDPQAREKLARLSLATQTELGPLNAHINERLDSLNAKFKLLEQSIKQLGGGSDEKSVPIKTSKKMLVRNFI